MSSTHVFLTLVLASGCCMWTTHVSAIQFNFNFNFKQWMPMHSTRARPQPSQCRDLKDTCPEWMYFGYCDNPEYETYMTIYCNKSCNMCTGGNKVQPRIVGGTVAARGAHPYMASVQKCTCKRCKCREHAQFKHHCGGTLIELKWVLTAAHCLYGESKKWKWSVLLGRNKLSSNTGKGYQRIGVERIIYHPDYKRYNGDRGDIALLKLKRSAIMTKYVQTLKLAPSGYNADGKDCITAGWGNDIAGDADTHTDPSGHPDKLQELSMKEVPASECKEYDGNEYVTKRYHLCAEDETFYGDPCFGDSGGPLQCGYGDDTYLAGVMKSGDPYCEGDEPAVFMRVSRYRDWIRNHMYRL